MSASYPTSTVKPTRPLRRPLSSPGLSLLSRQRFPAAASARIAEDGSTTSTVSRNESLLTGLDHPAPLCYICGKQGNFRCMRCKKKSYCSVDCQTEDWKNHRYTCKAVDPEPEIKKPEENVALQSTGLKESLAELPAGDTSSNNRVYLKHLQASKINKMDFQATVVEFTSPCRFFIVPQIPEMYEALHIIRTELQKACSSFSGTAYLPCEGEVCTVQFSYDKNWYRGLVQTLSADNQTADILYIDFGNEEKVPVERIRPLPANLKNFSPCAMECRIAGVVPMVNGWSDKCCLAVKQLLAGKTVTVKLLKTMEKECANVVDILLSKGNLLSAFLVENGYAQEETADAKPTEKDIDAILNASFENFKCLSDGKDDNQWAQPPPPIPKSVGEQFPVIVTHFVSPSDFIVQKVENAQLIQELQLKLRDSCVQVSMQQNFRPAPGTACCAQFSEDKQWYRVKVLAYPSAERVCVGYLDFGNFEEVNLDQLLPITTSLLDIPMQAIPCALAGVQPVGTGWSMECILALQCRLSNKVLHVEIQGEQEGKALVSVIDEGSDPQADLAELLIHAGYASPVSVSTAVNLPAEETIAAAESSVCSSVSPSVSGALVWTTVELPSDGQMVELLPTVVENPGKFYCHLCSPTELQKFAELEFQLKEHCEAETSPFSPKVGEPCCALTPGKGAWARAMVEEVSGDRVVVNFLDSGFKIPVNKGHLRSITPKLLTIPFQAVCCWLEGVEPIGSEWSGGALVWFQNFVGGQQLSARVLSVTDRGYGVELICRGQNMAAALIIERLAKATRQPAKETLQLESTMQKQDSRSQASQHVETSSREFPNEIQTSVAAGFPVDWKTVELPLKESFHPHVAAVISPSLFYLLRSTEVDQKKIQKVMMDLDTYCNTYQPTLSSEMKSSPAAGAACCAQYSEDKIWYRAVILEVDENEIGVIYADYGNIEKVPRSRILPIPDRLLQLPFPVTRCTLTGKEGFPAEWPKEVQQMFQTELLNGVIATVESFDGSANVLSLTLPAERGGQHLSAMILDALQACKKCDPETSQKLENAGSSSQCVPDGPQSKPVPELQCELENNPAPVDTTESIKPPELTAQPQQKVASVSPAFEDPVKEIVGQMEQPNQNYLNGSDNQASGCCCQSLRKQMDSLEHMMQLQLSLIKQLVGQKK
ncbi:PREDICTED: tudor domain-containing protein 1 [Cyprinodon variegatus]|uniref:tudor domain-containing protein 1 n=1 Tax=Cyprinodon variegatus TaxID=28743 RepID=UPI0007429832|nr:PREDICTED: tudor domain-containing protein 1 [Cyprinodon variegatus]